MTPRTHYHLEVEVNGVPTLFSVMYQTEEEAKRAGKLLPKDEKWRVVEFTEVIKK